MEEMKTEIVSLAGHGFIQYRWDCSDDGTLREFKVYSSMGTIFEGYGFDGTRECRHTYWYPDNEGYGFYPNGVLICAAFKDLSKYFDDMWISEKDEWKRKCGVLARQIKMMEEYAGLKVIMMGTEDNKILEEYLK